jgi:hypothetical protein
MVLPKIHCAGRYKVVDMMERSNTPSGTALRPRADVEGSIIGDPQTRSVQLRCDIFLRLQSRKA